MIFQIGMHRLFWYVLDIQSYCKLFDLVEYQVIQLIDYAVWPNIRSFTGINLIFKRLLSMAVNQKKQIVINACFNIV